VPKKRIAQQERRTARASAKETAANGGKEKLMFTSWKGGVTIRPTKESRPLEKIALGKDAKKETAAQEGTSSSSYFGKRLLRRGTD